MITGEAGKDEIQEPAGTDVMPDPEGKLLAMFEETKTLQADGIQGRRTMKFSEMTLAEKSIVVSVTAINFMLVALVVGVVLWFFAMVATL